mgnify:CR=1 FL=1
MRSRANLVLVAALVLSACAARIPVEDGQPVSVNALHVEDRDTALVAALSQGAAYWEVCGVHFAADRTTAAHVIDVEIVDVLPDEHAGEWYTDGVWTRMRLSRSELIQCKGAELPNAIAHEFGHAFGLVHLDGSAVMNATIQPHTELTTLDREAFRAATGRSCSESIR